MGNTWYFNEKKKKKELKIKITKNKMLCGFFLLFLCRSLARLLACSLASFVYYNCYVKDRTKKDKNWIEVIAVWFGFWLFRFHVKNKWTYGSSKLRACSTVWYSYSSRKYNDDDLLLFFFFLHTFNSSFYLSKLKHVWDELNILVAINFMFIFPFSLRLCALT